MPEPVLKATAGADFSGEIVFRREGRVTDLTGAREVQAHLTPTVCPGETRSTAVAVTTASSGIVRFALTSADTQGMGGFYDVTLSAELSDRTIAASDVRLLYMRG